jgi:Cu(I)/Ag(I) efflux system membrane fusion protein/cobalt-zinc-cadmium efflux system membrane fusion protein
MKMTGPAMTGEKIESAPTPVQLSPERMQSIGVKTGSSEYRELSNDIRATGTVDVNERLVSYVQVRFPGYIRRVFANATYQYVRQGDPLFTVYSPDLVATEQEYLLARQNSGDLSRSGIDGVAAGAASLSVAAEHRLAQWEVPASAIVELRETGKPITDLTINSPVSGYITERNALPNMYVEPSTRLYTVTDLSRIWVYAQVFQDDIGRVKPGDHAEITVDSYPGRTFSGVIEDILPQVDLTTRTVRVRLAIENPGLKLRPGMFVNVDLKSSLGRQLVVPASAVFQSGTRQLVFLDHGNGSLEPKEVATGPRVGDDVVILKGLKAHQAIVTSANFLIDSESQLQAAAGSFMPPPPGSGGMAAQGGQPQAAQANIDFNTDPNPPQRGNNIFRVKLTDSKGAPVSGADVTVTFFMAAMPAMGMAAMNTTAKLSDKGNGMYEGPGSLGSGGTWRVTITAQKSGQVIATKQLTVDATGGM